MGFGFAHNHINKIVEALLKQKERELAPLLEKRAETEESMADVEYGIVEIRDGKEIYGPIQTKPVPMTELMPVLTTEVKERALSTARILPGSEEEAQLIFVMEQKRRQDLAAKCEGNPFFKMVIGELAPQAFAPAPKPKAPSPEQKRSFADLLNDYFSAAMADELKSIHSKLAADIYASGPLDWKATKVQLPLGGPAEEDIAHPTDTLWHPPAPTKDLEEAAKEPREPGTVMYGVVHGPGCRFDFKYTFSQLMPPPPALSLPESFTKSEGRFVIGDITTPWNFLPFDEQKAMAMLEKASKFKLWQIVKVTENVDKTAIEVRYGPV